MEQRQDYEENSISYSTLDHLEELSYDPYMHAMNAKADEIEELLNSLRSSAKDRTDFRDSLDSEWRFMGETIDVSGVLLINNTRPSDIIPTYERHYVEDSQLVSTGFAIVPFAAGVLDDEVIMQYRVAYSFDKAGKNVAMLRNEMASVFPNESFESTEKRLLYHHPDEVVRVEEKLAEQDSIGQSRLLGFGDYAVDVHLFSSGAETFISDMEQSIFEKIEFDLEVPYAIGYVMDTSDPLEQPTEHIFVARPSRIRLLPLHENTDTSPCRFTPWIELTVYDVDSKRPSSVQLIPIQAIRSVRSLRSYFYSGAH